MGRREVVDAYAAQVRRAQDWCERCGQALTLADTGAPRFLHPSGEAVCPLDNADGEADSGSPFGSGPITRTIIHVEVFSRGPLVIPDYPEGGDLYDPLQGILADMIDGNKIGDWSIASTETITDPATLRGHLARIGNDGSFFDDED